MSTTTGRKYHPSNRLYNGDVRTFREAIRTVEAACDFERHISEAYNASLGPDEQHERCPEDIFDDFKAVARQALAIYEREVGEAEQRAIAAMRATGNEDLRRFAACLESGEYSDLAI